MGERLVRVGHFLDVVTLLHCGTKTSGRVHDLVGKTLGHGLLAASTGVFDNPPDGERRRAARAHLNRYRVRGTTHAAATHLERWFDVVDCPLDGVDRLFIAIEQVFLKVGCSNTLSDLS